MPLPPERPREVTAPPLPAPVSLPPTNTAPPPIATAEETIACDRWLASGTAVAQREDAPAPAAPGCGITSPVRVTAVRLGTGGEVKLQPAPLLTCSFAASYVAWVRDDLAPLLASHGGGLKQINGGGGYECRSVDRLGATLSEHAVGNAIDVIGFQLADGTMAQITKVADSLTLFAKAKITTCARFATVLGPGSDSYHTDNLHLDAKARRGGFRLCEWQLP